MIIENCEFSPIPLYVMYNIVWASFTVKAAETTPCIQMLFCCQAQCTKTNSGLNCQAGAICCKTSHFALKMELQTNVSRWTNFSAQDETATVLQLISTGSDDISTVCVWVWVFDTKTLVK